MTPPTGGAQLDQASTDYGQLGNEGTMAFGSAFPDIKTLLPMLMSAMTGQGPMYEAARSPAIAQTQQMIRTGQNSELGATANPNALWQDIATQGEQTASLGANSIITNAMQTAGQLLQSLMGFSGSSLTNAGQGETQVGEYMNQNNQAFWANMFKGLGLAASMFVPGGGALANMAPGGATPTATGPSGANSAGFPTGGAPGSEAGPMGATTTSPTDWGGNMSQGGFNATAAASGVMPAGSATGMSAPVSAPAPGMGAGPNWQQEMYLPGYNSPGM